ncbi:hypothetical protein [Morganella phage Mecenats66]|nr:hypothetical protein [Morganella phage Mecenats66]
MSSNDFLIALKQARPPLADSVTAAIDHIAPYLPQKTVDYLREFYVFGEADSRDDFGTTVALKTSMSEAEYSHAKIPLKYLDSAIIDKHRAATVSAVSLVSKNFMGVASLPFACPGWNVIFNYGVRLRVGTIISFDRDLRLFIVRCACDPESRVGIVTVREENCRIADNHFPGTLGVISCSELAEPW